MNLSSLSPLEHRLPYVNGPTISQTLGSVRPTRANHPLKLGNFA